LVVLVNGMTWAIDRRELHRRTAWGHSGAPERSPLGRPKVAPPRVAASGRIQGERACAKKPGCPCSSINVQPPRTRFPFRGNPGAPSGRPPRRVVSSRRTPARRSSLLGNSIAGTSRGGTRLSRGNRCVRLHRANWSNPKSPRGCPMFQSGTPHASPRNEPEINRPRRRTNPTPERPPAPNEPKAGRNKTNPRPGAERSQAGCRTKPTPGAERTQGAEDGRVRGGGASPRPGARTKPMIGVSPKNLGSYGGDWVVAASTPRLPSGRGEATGRARSRRRRGARSSPRARRPNEAKRVGRLGPPAGLPEADRVPCRRGTCLLARV
jgi:hypothetical protein